MCNHLSAQKSSGSSYSHDHSPISLPQALRFDDLVICRQNKETIYKTRPKFDLIKKKKYKDFHWFYCSNNLTKCGRQKMHPSNGEKAKCSRSYGTSICCISIRITQLLHLKLQTKTYRSNLQCQRI